MPHLPNDIYTVNVIADFVDAIRATEPITLITNVGDLYTISTAITHDLADMAEVEIDGATYIILNVVTDVSFDISSPNAIVGAQWKALAPYYYHGTRMAVNEDLSMIGGKKYPCVYLHEIFNEKENRDRMSNTALKSIY